MNQIQTITYGSLKTWALLMLLLIAGVSATAPGLPHSMALAFIFGAAAAQTVTIGRYYMRLRSEDLLIYALALLPVALVIILTFVIRPDVGMFQ